MLCPHTCHIKSSNRHGTCICSVLSGNVVARGVALNESLSPSSSCFFFFSSNSSWFIISFTFASISRWHVDWHFLLGRTYARAFKFIITECAFERWLSSDEHHVLDTFAVKGLPYRKDRNQLKIEERTVRDSRTVQRCVQPQDHFEVVQRMDRSLSDRTCIF